MRLSIRSILLFLCALPFGMGQLHAQVPASVEIKRQAYDTAVTIDIRWSAAEEKVWHQDHDGMLDILALKTAIRSENLRKAVSGTTTYTFGFENSATVEMMVSIDFVSDGEEVFLLDNKRGEVIFNFTDTKRTRFLTPDFDPATTVLVWKSTGGSPSRSVFRIDNIYYQPQDGDRALDIGFGTSLPCEPNAACKQDSLFQLISSSAVRIRLVMEEGIGWCTGSFVNNTRNDKTPYLLTAYHCQFNSTPLYDMWRFDFQYASSSCSNPANEPQYFSMTGCALVSSGQASDFLLVLLNQEVPINQKVTFAGWDRDDTAKPDTSYLVHHPNADIRKFSTSVNQATIHPNQIGWSEGYTTPANHHFRLKFTEGGHEPGSSGGPLFNQDGYLVGQLHGGNSGCEATNNAFAGRFAKSWNLGSTPEGRLSDWLDPDQTGLTKITSIQNIESGDVMDIHGLVKNQSGVPLKNATIRITGSVDETMLTTENGTFELNGVSRNGQYIITPEKTENPTNGLNALDLIAIQKHLLGKDTFDFPWQYIAADATNNSQLSVGDIVVLQRLLLGKILTLPGSPSWRFDPSQLVIDPTPPGEPVEIEMTGIKIGDVNGTADPNK